MIPYYKSLLKSCKTPKTLSQIHTQLLKSNLHKDILTSTKLIETYSQTGNLHYAQLVFNTFPSPDPFMYGILIKNYVYNSFFSKAISLYHHMISNINEHYVCNEYIMPSLLKCCGGIRDVSMGRKFHGGVIKTGVECNEIVATTLVCMYGECGSLSDACKVFDEMPEKDLVSWSSMVLGYVRCGWVYEGLGVFRKMVFEGIEVDYVTMLSVAEACCVVCDCKLAKSVHGYILRKMITSDDSLKSCLIVMYNACGNLDDAKRLFDEVSCVDTASWTAMISCYNQSGCFREALDVFVEMQKCNVEPNSVTVVGVLVSCGQLVCLREGMSVHGFIIRSCMDPDMDTVGSALMDMYAKCGKLMACENVFGSIQEMKIDSWNSLISVYARNGSFKAALKLFVHLRLQGFLPDSYTLASSLPACGKIGYVQLGNQMHALIAKIGFETNEFVQNALIDMYCKCGFVDSAYKLFNRMQEKSLVTWNSIICGFTQNGNSAEAINLVDQMYCENLEMDKITFLSAIQSCSHLGHLEKGKWCHHKLVIYGLEKDSYVDTALTDMYAKCGDLSMAQMVFGTMSKKSVVSWSSMIAGYGIHGLLENAISLFSQMVDIGIRPNEVTFMSILSACSHAGSVEEGMFYFDLMRKDFGIEPCLEHYIFIVDLLSRAGEFTRAIGIIVSMSVPVSPAIWGAVLNGCRIHGRLDMIESIQKRILQLDAANSGYYTLLSNIYAEGGRWDEFRKMRLMMQDVGLRKVPGYSMIQIYRLIYRFRAGDTSNYQINEIHKVLEDLQNLAQKQGYVIQRKSSICRSSDERKSSVCQSSDEPQNHNTQIHSEKLALAFGILNTSPGTTLRIFKNLRVCMDCHTFTKFVSKITNREIIMRDLNRFHHFNNGTCSCRDFW